MRTLAISNFFANTLGIPLKNSRWSWGAYDKARGIIVLKTWRDDRGKKKDHVSILGHIDKKNNGRNERREHIAHLKNGSARGYAVECKTSKGGKTKSYDGKKLLKLGKIVSERGRQYAQIEGEITIKEFLRDRDAVPINQNRDMELISQINQIENDKSLKRTEKDALIRARLGQGKFREKVLELWGKSCAVTGCDLAEVLRASHIKPWNVSDNKERLDPNNGLPLVAHLDALFDKGLISFNRRGTMLISSRVSQPQRDVLLLGIPHNRRIKLNDKQLKYLEWHREKVFK